MISSPLTPTTASPRPPAASAQTAPILTSMSRPAATISRPAARPPLAPYFFLTPYCLITAVFFLYPLGYAFYLAFRQTAGPARSAYVGLSNFSYVLRDPDFHTALKNTTFFAACSLLLQLPLSLGLALLLNSKNDRTKAFFRLAIFAPNLVGQVFVGILFSILFTPRYGMFNRLLDALVGWGLEQQWLMDPSLVMPAVVIASLWMYVGFNMVYFLAALQNVDQSLVEAARIDGAGPAQTFLNVTLPAIAPVATFVVVTSTIGSFQLFELPYALLQITTSPYGTKFSGLTIVGYLYMHAFENGDLGTAAAVGWLLTLLILAISLIQIRISSRFGSHK